MSDEVIEIERGSTGVRFLYTLLFFLIAQLLEGLFLLLILFELLYALVTQEPPTYRVRRFANRVIGYLYRVLRYLTYNEECPPFPFAEFPTEVEPVRQPEPEEA